MNAGRTRFFGHKIGERGGRIVGEVCHFVDLLQYLTERRPFPCLPKLFRAITLPPSSRFSFITLRFDGSNGAIAWLKVTPLSKAVEILVSRLLCWMISGASLYHKERRAVHSS
jgi:hypothetical protein